MTSLDGFHNQSFFMRYNQQILVICHLHEMVLQKYAAYIQHRPDLARVALLDWQQAIEETKPRLIIFNTEIFNKDRMQIWRNCLPDEDLYVIRAGTSLSRCDLEAAQFYSIRVLNTPGINSKYAADYMNSYLFDPYSPSDRIAIIGAGNIGSRIAIAAADYQVDFILYNKSRKSSLLKHLDQKIKFALHLEEAIVQANKIAVSLPLDHSTQGIITEDLINKIPKNSLLISVSPPKVFTDAALRKLYHRADIHVIIDDLKSELQRIHRIIGSPNSLRQHFLMDEKAVASVECQNAMTSTAIEKGMSLLI
jgi:lactate dehydrogenase-like 2-hydroxyacid dehydrogenase